MKKSIIIITLLSLMLPLNLLPAIAVNDGIPVYLDNQRLALSDPPIIKNGRTLAPMRGLFEALGAKVSWDSANQTAIGERDGIIVKIPIGSTMPMVNNTVKQISVAAEIIRGRTYIPLRFVGEALGDEVNWNSSTRSVEVFKKQIKNVYKHYSVEAANNIYNVPNDYKTIQQAIEVSKNGDAIVVEKGTYEENIDFLGKEIIVTSVYGPEQTILHGGYEGPVVVMHNNETNSSILYGFTITKGAAGLSENNDESLIFPRGGGISILNASPIVRECIITMNAATDFGGGIYISGINSRPLIEYNQITKNISHYQGAGISVNDRSEPTIRKNTISNNFAEAATGIVFTDRAGGVIEDNTIKNNIAGYDTNPELVFEYLKENPSFKSWTEQWGQHPAFPSGILVSQNSYPSIINNVITGNDGGGIGVLHSSTPTIKSNTIISNGNNNLGAITGGIMVAYNAKPIISLNTISNNIGPAVWIDRRNSEILDANNKAIKLPVGSSNHTLSNNKVDGFLVSWPYERPIVNTSNNPKTIRVPDDYIYIQDAIDTSNHGDVIIIAPGVYNQSIDFKGKHITVRSQDPFNENIVNSTILQGGNPNAIDNGQGPIVMFINGEGNNAKLEGLTLKNQDDDYFNMSTIYIESASPTITNNQITSKNGTAIQMNWAYSNLYKNEKREEAGRFTSQEGYETAPIIAGNTIHDSKIGGGMWYYYASPNIKNNEFINNNGPLSGAIHNWFSSATIEDNKFINNSGEVGGAIHFENFAIPSVVNNTFYNNSANGGAAIHIDSPTYGVIDRNVFKNNQVSVNSIGSAVSVGMLADISITNNLITENYGWPIYAGGARINLMNNTLANNWSEKNSNNSQGAFAMGLGEVTGQNNIFYNSSLNDYQGNGKGYISITNSLFYDPDQSAWPGNSNTYANPRFVGVDNYKLSTNSPAIDSGVDVELDTDLVGNKRPQGNGYDIGAYEFLD